MNIVETVVATATARLVDKGKKDDIDPIAIDTLPKTTL